MDERINFFLIPWRTHTYENFKGQKELTAGSANELVLNYCQGVKSCQENLLERAVMCLLILWKILKHSLRPLNFSRYFNISKLLCNYAKISDGTFNDVQRNRVEKHCCRLLCLNQLTPLWFIFYWAFGAAFLIVKTNDISSNHYSNH